MATMKVWIPQKIEIEMLLVGAANKIHSSDTVSEVEEWLDNELSLIDCHISNRAGIERGDIKEQS